jgi:hypothetical protein
VAEARTIEQAQAVRASVRAMLTSVSRALWCSASVASRLCTGVFSR